MFKRKILFVLILFFVLVSVADVTSAEASSVRDYEVDDEEESGLSKLIGIWKDAGPGYAHYYQLITSGNNRMSIKYTYTHFDDPRTVSNMESVNYDLTVQGLDVRGTVMVHWTFPEAGKYPPPQKFTVRGNISEDGNRISLVLRGPKFVYGPFTFSGPIEENVTVLRRD